MSQAVHRIFFFFLKDSTQDFNSQKKVRKISIFFFNLFEFIIPSVMIVLVH